MLVIILVIFIGLSSSIALSFLVVVDELVFLVQVADQLLGPVVVF